MILPITESDCRSIVTNLSSKYDHESPCDRICYHRRWDTFHDALRRGNYDQIDSWWNGVSMLYGHRKQDFVLKGSAAKVRHNLATLDAHVFVVVSDTGSAICQRFALEALRNERECIKTNDISG